MLNGNLNPKLYILYPTPALNKYTVFTPIIEKITLIAIDMLKGGTDSGKKGRKTSFTVNIAKSI